MFLSIAECAYLIEAVIYIFMGSYLYHPMFIKHNYYYDSHMGALTSNLFIIPVLATLVAMFHLKPIWILFIIGCLWGVEWLFVELKIYTLNWWRIPYTSSGLLLFFPLSKIIYKRILQPLKGFKHSLILFLCIGPLSGTLQYLPFMLFSSRSYLPGWYKDPSYDTSAFGIVIYIFNSILQVIIVKLPWNTAWIKYSLLEVIIIAETLFLKEVDILQSHVWWDQWFYIAYPLVIFRFASFISEKISNGPETISL